LHVDPRQVQEIAADAVPMIQHQRATGQVETGGGEGDRTAGRRPDRRATGSGDVHAGMRRLWRAIVHALAAEAPADAALHRPTETLGEPGFVAVAAAHGSDLRLFALDARGEGGWRIDRRRGRAVDVFHGPVARYHFDEYRCAAVARP